jgi:hypothetical protein
MLTMIYMTRIQNMSFFLLKVNNPFVRHPVWPAGHSVWPCRAPRRAPVWPCRAPHLATIGHPVQPRLVLRLATPSGPPSGTPSGHPRLATPSGHPRLATPVRPPPSGPRPAAVGSKKKKKKFFFFFWLLLPAGKEGKKYFSFRFSIPKIPKIPKYPKFPNSPGFAGEAVRRRRFFWPSSPSHTSELYSSLGWLNSKVPKPFFPFTLRLIDVDGF